MRKRLTAQGPAGRQSYTVTLPKEWVVNNNLEKSREVHVQALGKSVVVSADKNTHQAIHIDGEAYADSLIKVLQGVYRSGVDAVHLTYKQASTVAEVQSIVDKALIGFEVVEQTRNSLTIQDITGESSQDFHVVLRRVFLLLLELSTTTDEQIIHSLDANCKRLINYCQRILVKHGHAEYERTPMYYAMLDRLEKIGDEWKWVMQSKASKATAELQKSFRRIYETLYAFKAADFNALSYHTYTLRKKYARESAPVHIHNLSRLLNSLLGDVYLLAKK